MYVCMYVWSIENNSAGAQADVRDQERKLGGVQSFACPWSGEGPWGHRRLWRIGTLYLSYAEIWLEVVRGSLPPQLPVWNNQALWSPTTTLGGASSWLLPITLLEGRGKRREPVFHLYVLQCMSAGLNSQDAWALASWLLWHPHWQGPG
jgi:hypothetical protein